MHQNYYFLRQLAPHLDARLRGLVLEEAFSQDKDELIFSFVEPGSEGRSFRIKASLRNNFSCLSFPEHFDRARRNSVSLFKGLYAIPVVQVKNFLNERAFSIGFEDGQQLVFKLFGNRSNIVLFNAAGIVTELFQNKLAADHQLSVGQLDRPIDQSFDAFLKAGERPEQLFPTFGKLVNRHLTDKSGTQTTAAARWQTVQETLFLLENPTFYTTLYEGTVTLSLLPLGDIMATFQDPVAAVNHFYTAYSRIGNLQQEKEKLIASLHKRILQTTNYLEKSYHKLAELEIGGKNDQMGHLLMAHLNQIPPRSEQVELRSFYTGEPVVIRLKKDLSPQKNAEIYYRKARNEKKELEQLQANITAREEDLAGLNSHLEEVEQITLLKALRAYCKVHGLQAAVAASGAPGQLFKTEEFMGFTILIGKSARNNDRLTRQAYKEDLWLHARDVSGSHVVVKYQPGKPFPAPVIERAAQLAAWHSKRRSDSLCPVIVTPRKFVRKNKGLADGAVIVEKEKVVLVTPSA